MAKQTAGQTKGTILFLDPDAIQMEDNGARFEMAVPTEEAQRMKASILEVGRVMEPVGVVELKPSSNGYDYRLRYGFRRVAGARLANKDGAGVKVPAMVLDETDPVGTLREQVAENNVRESLSLMDQASAARKLLDAGVSREDVQTIFTRPKGTKGGGVQPASPAWLNMVLSLLKFPVSIQARIHKNDIGLAAAYRLAKAPADKWEIIVERAESEMESAAMMEAQEEAAYVELETRAKATEKEAEEAVTALDTKKAEVEIAEKAVEEKKAEVADLYGKKLRAEAAVKRAKTDDAKKEAKDAYKEATERWKGAETDVKAAEAAATKEQTALTKAEEAQKKLIDRAAELRDRLEAKRNAQPKAAVGVKKAISPAAIEKAAKAEGVEEVSGRVRMKGPEMRKLIEELSQIVIYPKAARVGAIILKCFDSISTPGEMTKELAAMLGEAKVVPGVSALTTPPAPKIKPRK